MGKTVLKLQITKSSSNKGFSTQQSCHSCNGPQPSKPNRTEPNQGTYSDLTATSAGMGSSWRFRYSTIWPFLQTVNIERSKGRRFTYSDLTATSAGMGSSWRFRYSTIWPFLQTVNRERNKGRRFTYSDLTATSAGMGSSWGAGSRLMILGVTLPPSRLRLMILGTTLSPSRLARSSSWSRRALGARSGQRERSHYPTRSPHSQVDIPSGAPTRQYLRQGTTATGAVRTLACPWRYFRIRSPSVFCHCEHNTRERGTHSWTDWGEGIPATSRGTKRTPL